jgi:hypothetical protein
MKSENWTRMQAASTVAVCLAALFITYGAWAQETKETVAVNDVDRTYLVRLPQGLRSRAEISSGDPAAWHESGD